MKRTFQRTIALLLMVVMLVGSLPFYALPAEATAEQQAESNANNEKSGNAGISYAILDWDDLSAKKPNGSGTRTRPYLITDANELLWIPKQVNDGTDFRGEYISLKENIDLNGFEWTPIGAGDTPFSGTFYGNGHEIKNFSVASNNTFTGEECHYVGFFGYTKGANIHDLGIADFTIDEVYSENTVIGGFAAYAEGCFIENCYAKGDIEARYKEIDPLQKAGEVTITPTAVSSIPTSLNYANEFGQTIILDLRKLTDTTIQKTISIGKDISYLRVVGNPNMTYTGLSFVLNESEFNRCIELMDMHFTSDSGEYALSGSNFCNTVYLRSSCEGNSITGSAGFDAINLPNASVYICGTADLSIIGGSGVNGDNGSDGNYGVSAVGNGQKGLSGASGKDGIHGTDGGRGVVAKSLIVNISDNTVTIQGGDGGNGGNGGHGGDGGKGGDAIWNIFDYSTRVNGGNGGAGGSGGNGGNGGRGNYALSVSSLTIEAGNCMIQSGTNGTGGAGGNGGNGGAGGNVFDLTTDTWVKGVRAQSTDASNSSTYCAGDGGRAGVNGKGGDAYYACNAIDEKLSTGDIRLNEGSLRITHGNSGAVGKAGAEGTGGRGGRFICRHLAAGSHGSPGLPASKTQSDGSLLYGFTGEGIDLIDGTVTGSGNGSASDGSDEFERLTKATIYLGGFVGRLDKNSTISYCSSINSNRTVFANGEVKNLDDFVMTGNSLRAVYAGNFAGENNGKIQNCLAAYVSEDRGNKGYSVNLYKDGHAAASSSGAILETSNAALIDTKYNYDTYGIIYGTEAHEGNSLMKDFIVVGMLQGAQEITIRDDAFDGGFIGKITKIWPSAFRNNGSLQTVEFENTTITVIPENAFYNCSNLRKATISNRIDCIEDRAFYDCKSLTEFTIPDGVTTVGEAILGNCNDIRTIKIGSGLKSMADHDGYRVVEGSTVPLEQPLFGFSKSESQLESYEVDPNNPYLCSDDYGVLYRKIDVGGTLTSVSVVDAPVKANLKNYNLPTHIVKIEPYAFSYNAYIQSVNLDYVRMIAVSAFEKCTGLHTVTLQSQSNAELEAAIKGSISYSQYIDDRAFRGCTILSIASIEADTIIGIGEEAFYGCPGLTHVTIGKKVQFIGLQAFGADAGSSNLERFTVEKDNTHFKSIGGVLYEILEDGSLLLKQYPACLTNVTTNGGKMNVLNFSLPTKGDDGKSVSVTGIDSYAFQGAKYLKTVTIGKYGSMSETPSSITIGDYAFYYAKNLTRVDIGSDVKSIGNKRDEGEYSVFAECHSLQRINVDTFNQYYSSDEGVLFNKNQSKLLKYPAGRTGSGYVVPDTVEDIGAMAFKQNTKLNTVTINSYVSTIGMEAFYRCSGLAVIFFDDVYAPVEIGENAFYTYYFTKDEEYTLRTIVGYSDDKFIADANANGKGWSSYSERFNLRPMNALPDVTVGDSYDNFYAIVIVDTNGERIQSVKDKDGKECPLEVSLTDPHGNTETVEAGKPSDGILDGAAVFYNLYGDVNLGFSVQYDLPYQLKVEDPLGQYFTFTSNEFYLDYDMRVSYITLSKQPEIFGLNCNEDDINSQTVVLNKAEYGTNYTVQLKDPSKGYVEGNIDYVEAEPETVTVSTIVLYDKVVQTLDEESLMLYQNGQPIPGCKRTAVTYETKSATATFVFAVEDLIPETPIEARFQVTDKKTRKITSGASFLNIDVIDFSITQDDINLDTEEISVDIEKGDSALASLLGSPQLSFDLGEHLVFSIAIDGDTISASLNASYNKEKTSEINHSTNLTDYKKGYEDNIQGHHGDTWRFERFFTLRESDNVERTYKMNIWFARGMEDLGLYYYRCSVVENVSKKEAITFYGLVKTDGGRAGCSQKASLISAVYSMSLDKDPAAGVQYVDIDKDFDIQNLFDSFRPQSSTKNSFEAALYGDIVFQYRKGSGIVPVTSEIRGELKYTFEHSRQFVVWVIPIVVTVKVDVGGKVELSLKYDEWKGVSLEDAKMTIEANLTASAGVGCSVVSAGITGTIGTVFIVHFYPQLGVESWEVHGGLGLYATYFTLKWQASPWGFKYPAIVQETKEYMIYDPPAYYIIDNRDQYGNGDGGSAKKETGYSVTAPLFLADSYEAANPEEYSENAKLFTVGDTIYKVGFVNMCKEIEVGDETDGVSYDEYNCMKLALSVWDEAQQIWNQVCILDDNGFNDFSFDLYQDETDTYFIFTQQTEKTNAETANDSYEYVSDLALKCISLEDALNGGTASTVCTGYNYKYLSTVANVNGTMTAVWVENSENNIFGVSKDNYVDESGNIHIFQTEANSIWISRLDAASGTWQEPVCVKSGLSAVAELAVTEAGYIAYILDENGNLADADDRNLYTMEINTGNTSNKTEEDDQYATSVKALGKDLVYGSVKDGASYLTALDLDQSNNLICLPESMSDAADVFSLITDEKGNAAAIVYIQNVTWEENGETVSGGELYGMFLNGKSWGKPIAIQTNAIYARKDQYISSYSATLSNGKLLINVAYVDKNGVAIGEVTESYSLSADCRVDGHEMSYANGTLNVTVTNKGAKAINIYAKVNEDTKLSNIALISGDTQTHTIDLSGYRGTVSVSLYDAFDNSLIGESFTVNLSHSNLTPYVKQLLLGDQNKLLVAVKNIGDKQDSGNVYVAVGNYTEDNIKDAGIMKSVGEIAPGRTVYLEISLSEDVVIDENTILTIYAESLKGNELGDAADDNIMHVTAQAFSSKVPESYEPEPEIGLYSVKYEKNHPQNIEIPYYCAQNDSVQAISCDGNALKADTDYTVVVSKIIDESNIVVDGERIAVSKAVIDRKIVLQSNYLAGLTGGKHSFTIAFANDRSATVSVTVIDCFNVRWENDDGSLICEQESVSAGTIPVCDKEFSKAPSAEWEYVFAGWDVNGDKIVDPLEPLAGDTVYRAVWREVDHAYSYQVTTEPTLWTAGTLTGTCTRCSLVTIVPLPNLNTTDYTKSITEVATCTAAGTEIYKWNMTAYGDFSFVATTDALGHSYTDKVTDPACTEQGYTTHTCSRCGDIYKDSYIDATGHSYSSKVTTAAACTTEGVKTYTCSKCSHSYTEAIAATGHTPVTDKAVAATCTTDGKTEGSHCSVCNAVIKAQTTIPATGHSYSSKVTTAATCTKEGVKTFTCSKCNHSYTEAISATGHTPVTDKAVAATCTTAGKTEGSHCSVCNAVIKAQTTVPATGHSYTSKVTTAATCTNAGVKTYTCSKCSHSYTEAISATGHAEVVDGAVAATCTTDGKTEGSHCSVCNAVIKAQETVPALGHDYTGVITDPTCTEQGYTTHTCSRCSDSYKDSYTNATGHNYSYTDKGEAHEAVCGKCSHSFTEAHSYTDHTCICGAVEILVPITDESIVINHSLNLASDISINYAVKASLLSGYDSFYMEVQVPIYRENALTGFKTLTIEPVLNGGYYYFTMVELTAMNMNDILVATLHMNKGKQEYLSKPDSYSVDTYAQTILNQSGMTDSLKVLCADLLRYGAAAQIYKNYRTDALATMNMTDAHRTYFSDLNAVTFGNVNKTYNDLTDPMITWAGKTMNLGSKVVVKFVFNAGIYTGDVSKLTLRMIYQGTNGTYRTVTLSNPTVYNEAKRMYAFEFDGLMAAELRTALSVAVYSGDTQLSQTMQYSADTYGNATSGTLLDLCKALFAYSDSAKAFFTK